MSAAFQTHHSDKPIDRMRSAFPDAAESSGGWYKARCQAHDDKTASLSFRERSNDSVQVKCFAGCDTKAVLQAVGLTTADLYLRKASSGKSQSDGKRIVKTYSYTDEQGNELFQAVRYNPKDFRQRHRRVDGEWEWSLEGIRRVLYRLPELLQAVASGERIFIVEGEKDVDNLRAIGLAATCNPMGGSNWRGEFNASLSGADVVILPDNDAAGRKHAAQVTNHLHGTAKSIRIVQLPDLPPKGDVSDWLASGGTAEQLSTLADATPLYVPTEKIQPEPKAADETSSNLFIVKTANEWIEASKLRPMPRKLWDDFWFEGELCILYSDANLGKSIVAVQIADNITRGFGMSGKPAEIEPQVVLYFDFELSDKQFELRYSDKCRDHYRFSENFLRSELNPDGDYDGDFQKHLELSLEQAVSTSGAKIIIVDNLTYLRSQTETAKDALPLMKFLKQLKAKYALSILTLAHTPKRDATRPLSKNDLQGSRMLMNFCDSSFAIGESHKEQGVRYLKQVKVRNDEFRYDADNVPVYRIAKGADNFLRFEFIDYRAEREMLKPLSDTEQDSLDAKIIAKKKEQPQLSNRQIAKALDTNHTRVNRVLERDEKDTKAVVKVFGIEEKVGTPEQSGTACSTVPHPKGVPPKTPLIEQKGQLSADGTVEHLPEAVPISEVCSTVPLDELPAKVRPIDAPKGSRPSASTDWEYDALKMMPEKFDGQLFANHAVSTWELKFPSAWAGLRKLCDAGEVMVSEGDYVKLQKPY